MNTVSSGTVLRKELNPSRFISKLPLERLALLLIFTSCSPTPDQDKKGEETIVSSFPDEFKGLWELKENKTLLVFDGDTLSVYVISESAVPQPSDGTETEGPELTVNKQTYSIKDDNLLLIAKSTDEYKSLMIIITVQGQSDVMTAYSYPEEKDILYFGEKDGKYTTEYTKYTGTADDWAKANGVTLPEDGEEPSTDNIDEKIEPSAKNITEYIAKLKLGTGKFGTTSDNQYYYTFVDGITSEETVSLSGIQFEGATYPSTTADVIFTVY